MRACESYDEKQILVQVAQGDETAFARLFHVHHKKIGGFILRLTGSHQMTQEIVQDVFIKIWTNRHELPELNSFESYLFIIARNHTFNILKKISREYLKKKEWLRVNMANSFTNTESPGWQEHHYRLVEEAIEKLPPQQKRVYLLSRNNGLKYEEIASRLNLSFETVKKHMGLALRSIRTYVTANKDVVLLLLLSFINVVFVL